LWSPKIQSLAFATQRCLQTHIDLRRTLFEHFRKFIIVGGDYAACGPFWIHGITSGMQVSGYFGFNTYSR
jgi:hypothetical protein